jgi:hypothetical protein
LSGGIAGAQTSVPAEIGAKAAATWKVVKHVSQQGRNGKGSTEAWEQGDKNNIPAIFTTAALDTVIRRRAAHSLLCLDKVQRKRREEQQEP